MRGRLLNLPWPKTYRGFEHMKCNGDTNELLDIKHAYHAMALDEHRKPFSPTLWHFLEEATPQTAPGAPSSQLRENWRKLHKDDEATEKDLSEAWGKLVDAEMREELKGHRSELLQVWFPGVHINVGGGSDDILKEKKSDFERKSDPNSSISFYGRL